MGSSVHPFSFPSSPLERASAAKWSEAERGRCVVEAAPQARPEDHLGGIFRSSFVAEYHLGLTSALQHCQHNGAFRFLAAQVFSDVGWIFGPHFESFLSSDGLNSVFFWSLFPGHFLHRFFNGIIDSWSSENKVFARKVLQKPCFRKNRLLVIRGSIFGVLWRLWEQVF